MAAQLGALGDQTIHLLIREVQAVAVVGGPATDAMLVAGARGVEQDDPRNVALLLLCVLGRVAKAAESGLIATGEDGGLEHVVIGVVDDVPEILLPLRAGIQAVAQAAGYAGRGVLKQLTGHVNELVEILLAVMTTGGLDDLVEGDAKRLALGCVGNLGLHGVPLLLERVDNPYGF